MTTRPARWDDARTGEPLPWPWRIAAAGLVAGACLTLALTDKGGPDPAATSPDLLEAVSYTDAPGPTWACTNLEELTR